MKIEKEDLDRITRGLINGLAILSDPKSIKRIVLITEHLKDVIDNAPVINDLSLRLDESTTYSVVVMERSFYERARCGGDYPVDLASFLANDKLEDPLATNFNLRKPEDKD